MFKNRIFLVTFLISAAIHGAIFIQHSNLAIFSKNKNEQQKIEMSYLKETQATQREKPAPSKTDQSRLKMPPKITIDKSSLLPGVDKENMFKEIKKIGLPDSSFTKPAVIKPDVIAIKKKITLPPIKPTDVDLDKINNPTYISYYQIVREKIRRAAYQNYTRIETGEVYLTFIISNEGYLTEVRLVEEKSPASPYLKEIALQSIKDASPFPSFPKELNYPLLSFNVVISFEIE
jgi:TonB family protein